MTSRLTCVILYLILDQISTCHLDVCYVRNLAANLIAAAPDTGEIEWVKTFGSTIPAERDDAALAIDADGNVYVVGETDYILPDQIHARKRNYDAFVRKYNANGSEIWTRQFGTNSDLGYLHTA